MNVFRRILTKRDFWPLFGAQALGAFNDNFFRSALIALVALGAFGGTGAERTIKSSLATGLMMLPFFLFSSVAGELADRLRKSRLVKITKTAEVLIMALAAFFFINGQVNALLVVLFLMGAQSTFFGPVKYGLLPEVLPEEDLVAGNGLVEAATFLAIVLGTMAGSYLAMQDGGTTVWMPVFLVLVAAAGMALAWKQPDSAPGQDDLPVSPKIWRSTFEIICSIRGRRDMWLAVLAISWFWAMGGVLITQIPVLCGTVIGGAPAVNTFLVTLFALGIGIGSIGVQWLLKGRVSAGLVPPSAACLGFFLILLAASVWSLPDTSFGGSQTVTLGMFLNNWVYLRLAVCCLLVSIAAGIFVVPLNAYLQHRAEAHERARVIAANNIVNAAFICLGSIIVMVMTRAGLGLHHVFVFVAATAVAVAVLTLYFLPATVLRQLAKLVIQTVYRPKIKGLEHIDALKDGPALLVSNHISLLDAVMLVAYIPRKLTFAIDTYWAQTWWLKPLLRIFTALPINPGQPLATRGLIEALNNGELVVIFPEGRITSTGGIMKVYEGSGLIAAKSLAPLVPVIIDGFQYSRYFGRLSKSLQSKVKVRASMTVMAPRPLGLKTLPGEKQRDMRHRAGAALYDLLTQCRFEAMDCDKNLWTALLETASRCGKNKLVLEDIQRKPLSYRGLINRAKVLGRRFASFSSPGENVGLLLPNSSVNVASLFGLWAAGRVGVMLNYTQGPAPLASAVATAQIKTVITSRAFLENIGLMEMVQSLPVKLVFMEDQKFGRLEKLAALFWKGRPASYDTPAVLVFTSGSEGKPKGVALSHRNMFANDRQFACLLDVNENDSMFNALPMFHSFGLNTGTIFPIVTGLKVFVYPSPLHTHAIPELIYDTRTTITVASDTFAAAWGKTAHPYDFSTVRIMVVGAEKLKPKTRALYAEKLGIRIFEGYGVTEGSPVLTVNSHLAYRPGAVGRVLPGIEARLDPVEGVEKGGKLVVKGPNVMMGYLWPDKPGVIVPPEDGWYDTGDIVEIDENGFVWIKGRFKRFAKIAGEMVSLAAVEEVAATLWPGRPQVVIALDDENKGEKLVYVSQEQNPDLPQLWQALKEAGQPELTYPRQFIFMPEIPMTPLGKVNMPKLMEDARAAVAEL